MREAVSKVDGDNLLIQPVLRGEPAWPATFPHRVVPLPDEWLPGLLLRSDEANHWECRTILTHVLSPGPEKFHRCWRTETPHLVVIQPSALKLDYLAQLLELPQKMLLATTYHRELAHLYNTTQPYPQLLSETFTFHLCPECLTEARILRRSLALPHITICPRHQTLLVRRCSCGTSLHLFHRQALPFTCHMCGQDWARLPVLKAVSSDVEKEND